MGRPVEPLETLAKGGAAKHTRPYWVYFKSPNPPLPPPGDSWLGLCVGVGRSLDGSLLLLIIHHVQWQKLVEQMVPAAGSYYDHGAGLRSEWVPVADVQPIQFSKPTSESNQRTGVNATAMDPGSGRQSGSGLPPTYGGRHYEPPPNVPDYSGRNPYGR
jgi:hypothetical protein